MVDRLLTAGHPLAVYARRHEVRQRIADAGVGVATELSELGAIGSVATELGLDLGALGAAGDATIAALDTVVDAAVSGVSTD